MTTKRYILLDVGTHCGQSISNFKKCPAYKWFDWKIYGFEPHPQLCAIARAKHPTVDIFCSAAWIHDNGIEFYEGADKLGQSHTVVKNKKTGNINYHKPLAVNSIDLSHWIKNSFNKETDFIILKMDIEGAEYDVLEKMIQEDSISYIAILFIEWHAHKIAGFDMNRHTNLVNKLKRLPKPAFILEERQLKRGQNWFTGLCDKNMFK